MGLKLRTIVLEDRHGEEGRSHELRAPVIPSPVIALQSFRPSHNSFCPQFFRLFTTNFVPITMSTFFLPSWPRGSFHLRVKAWFHRPRIEFQPPPLWKYFSNEQFESKQFKLRRSIKRETGSPGGARNFSPKEKINTSQHAPRLLFFFNPSRLGTYKKVFFVVFVKERLEKGSFYTWQRLDADRMNCPRFSRRCIIIARHLLSRSRNVLIRDVLARLGTTTSITFSR